MAIGGCFRDKIRKIFIVDGFPRKRKADLEPEADYWQRIKVVEAVLGARVRFQSLFPGFTCGGPALRQEPSKRLEDVQVMPLQVSLD